MGWECMSQKLSSWSSYPSNHDVICNNDALHSFHSSHYKYKFKCDQRGAVCRLRASTRSLPTNVIFVIFLHRHTFWSTFLYTIGTCKHWFVEIHIYICLSSWITISWHNKAVDLLMFIGHNCIGHIGVDKDFQKISKKKNHQTAPAVPWKRKWFSNINTISYVIWVGWLRWIKICQNYFIHRY